MSCPSDGSAKEGVIEVTYRLGEGGGKWAYHDQLW